MTLRSSITSTSTPFELMNRRPPFAFLRPTNPTGNVLDDDEVDHLRQLACDHNIPLIVDNAYGAPFPTSYSATSRRLGETTSS